MYDKALFKEITQWTMPTREKVIIDNSQMFSYIPRATQTITDPEPVGTFTDQMIKNFDAAAVTANIGTTVAIVLTIIAIVCLFYFCYYKRVCNHCCRGRAKSSTLEKTIPNFCEEPVNVHWFKEQDQPEPDTISSLAATGRPSRNTSFRSPLRDLNTAFPKWIVGHSTPREPQLRTSTQMARDLEGMESYQDKLARAQISGLQSRPTAFRPR